MFLTGRDPDHVSLANLVDGIAPALHTAHPSRHDEGLAQRMDVPGGACPRLERDEGTARPPRGVCPEHVVDAHGPGEMLGRPLPRGLRAAARDSDRLHARLLG